MKSITRFIVILFIVAAAVGIIGGVISVCVKRTRTDDVKDGRVRFEYGTEKSLCDLSHSDLKEISRLLDGKALHGNKSDYIFSDKIYISFNNGEMIFCPALDGNPVIYLKNSNMHFFLTEEENNHLQKILSDYGFRFPCV